MSGCRWTAGVLARVGSEDKEKRARTPAVHRRRAGLRARKFPCYFPLFIRGSRTGVLPGGHSVCRKNRTCVTGENRENNRAETGEISGRNKPVMLGENRSFPEFLSRMKKEIWVTVDHWASWCTVRCISKHFTDFHQITSCWTLKALFLIVLLPDHRPDMNDGLYWFYRCAKISCETIK